jgi:DNA-binding protein H-NS
MAVCFDRMMAEMAAVIAKSTEAGELSVLNSCSEGVAPISARSLRSTLVKYGIEQKRKLEKTMARYMKGGSGMDLSELSVKELETLRSEIDNRIDQLAQIKKQEALARLDELVETLGLDGEEIAAHFRFRKGPLKASRGSGSKKYQNPNNSEQSWSGRGRKPAWVNAHLDAGGELKSLEGK